MAVQQAIGAVKALDAATAYLAAYVEDIKASGLVTRLIDKHAIKGALVASMA